MVDFVDEVAAFGMLDDVYCQQASANRARRVLADFGKFGGEGADFTLSAAGGVRNPMRGMAIDGGNRLIVDDEDADVAVGFVDEFLDVENRVFVRAENGFMLEDGFRRVAVIDFGEQASPRANHRLEDNGIAHFFDGVEGGCGRIGDARLRLGDIRA